MDISAPHRSADGTPLERRQAVLQDRVARFERMLEIRLAEERIRDLHAHGGAWGSTHTCDGQEAVAVGVAAACRPTDLVTCAHRTHGLALALGLPVERLIGEILGRSNGSVGGLGGSFHLTELEVGLVHTLTIIGASIPIACGTALAAQVKGTDSVSVAVFGDGAANIGAFHEGLNLAAIWKLPVVFICENNHYGEFTRVDLATSVADIALRGSAYNIPWAIVDGQDVDAVASKVTEALDRARSGGGPTLLEMKTYRFTGHSRTDQALYRPPGELEQWLARDPIRLFEARLKQEGLLTDAQVTRIEERIADRISEAVARSEAAPEPDAAEMFRHVYTEPGS